MAQQLTNIGALLISEALPEELRQEQYELNKKGIHKLFMDLAEKHADKYKDVLQQLSSIGATAAWTEGASVSLASLRKSAAKEALLAPIRQKIQATIDDDTLSDDERERIIVETLIPQVDKLNKAVYEESKAENSPFVLQLDSGARGKRSDINSLRGADLLATDAQDKFMPVPLWRSYAEGMTPAQYFAASYGQRKGAIGVKFCLCEDELVKMADGSTKPIRDVQPGDSVLTCVEGSECPTQVVRVYDNGPRECFTYEIAVGASQHHIAITCTAEHKVLASTVGKKNKAWSRPAELRPFGDIDSRFELTPVSPEPYLSGGGVDEPWALFAGLMTGDGCTSSKTPTFSCGDATLVHDVNSYLRGLGVDLRGNTHNYNHTLATASGRVVKIVHKPNGQISHTEKTSPAVIAVHRLGLYGKDSYTKSLPVGSEVWSTRSWAAYLGGLYSTDGSLWENKQGCKIVSIALTSLNVIAGIQAVLHRFFNIPVRMTVLPIRAGTCMRHEQYQLVISHPTLVHRFLMAVPLYGQKRKRAEKWMASTRNSAQAVFRVKRRTAAGVRKTFDLEVAHPGHTFVLASGLVVANSTADAGYMSKRLNNAAHRIVVTRDAPPTTRLLVGLPVSVDDRDSVGAVLAHDAGPVKAGTVLTSDHLDDIKDAGIDEILLHSAMTEPSEDGGISRLAAGRRLNNDPPPIGENIGLQSAQTVGERLSQGMLGSKHKTSNSAKANKSGIEYLNRLLDAPEHFPEAGPLAEEDGVVGDVVKAPQGGSYLHVGSRKYYVPEGITPIVKSGDHVELGDELTDGTPHPEQLVRLRGVGEARRVYLQHFRDALTASGAETHRRNLEPVVAGLLNWARVSNPDGIGDNVYDDVVPFNRLTTQYKPRVNAVEQDPDQAVGAYMEEPALHYTPGTRITKKVAKHLKKWGVKSVFTHKDAPDFEPQMVRSMYSVYHDPDWRTKLLGFYTSAAFTEAVQRGGESDLKSTSYAPALAKPNVLGRHLSSLGKYGRAG